MYANSSITLCLWSKIVGSCTMIKSLIIFDSFMPWKKKTNAWWPLGIRVKVQQQGSLIMIIYNEQID
jgi:hypothetical protein